MTAMSTKNQPRKKEENLLSGIQQIYFSQQQYSVLKPQESFKAGWK
jgi:hypothetical protein